jgi:hypothetical protein
MMNPMKHLAYTHQPTRTLAGTILGGIRSVLPRRLRSPNVAGGAAPKHSWLIIGTGWLIALAVQAALLLLVAELVEVAHGVMELYLDLAQQQLDLTSLYVSATSPE